jgi:hypothetical protein
VYFWSINGLKNSLIEKPLSENTAFLYLLLYVFFTALFMEIATEPESIWDLADDIVAIGSVVIGTVYCFFKNGAGQGSNFLQRYFSIGWVVHVRLAVMFFIPFIIVLFVIPNGDFLIDSWRGPLFNLFFYFLIYWRIGHHIGQVAENMALISNENKPN